MKKTKLTLLFVVTFGAGFGLASRARPHAAPAASPSPDSESAAAKAAPAVAAVIAAAAAQAAAPTPPPPEAAPAAAPEPAPAPADPVAERARIKQLISDTLETTLATEPVDAAWKYETESKLRSAFDQASVSGASLTSVTCGSTLCRAVVATADFEVQRGLATHVATIPPFDNEVYYEYRDGEASLYVARDDHHLPRPEGL